VNPWGIKILAQWGAIFFWISRPHAANAMQTEAFIGEFSPTRFSWISLLGTSGLLQAVATAFIVLGAAGIVLLLWRRRFAESLLLLGATYGALRYLRFQALASIVIVMVLGRALDAWLARDRAGDSLWAARVRVLASVACIVLAVVFGAQYVSNRYYIM